MVVPVSDTCSSAQLLLLRLHHFSIFFDFLFRIPSPALRPKTLAAAPSLAFQFEWFLLVVSSHQIAFAFRIHVASLFFPEPSVGSLQYRSHGDVRN
jgi:hypothetical protein